MRIPVFHKSGLLRVGFWTSSYVGCQQWDDSELCRAVSSMYACLSWSFWVGFPGPARILRTRLGDSTHQSTLPFPSSASTERYTQSICLHGTAQLNPRLFSLRARRPLRSTRHPKAQPLRQYVIPRPPLAPILPHIPLFPGQKRFVPDLSHFFSLLVG
jgi:hypothetical protein